MVSLRGHDWVGWGVAPWTAPLRAIYPRVEAASTESEGDRSPPRPPPQILLGFLRKPGRKICKVGIFVPVDRLPAAKIPPRPDVHAAGHDFDWVGGEE